MIDMMAQTIRPGKEGSEDGVPPHGRVEGGVGLIDFRSDY